MKYFEKFPTIVYNNVDVKNIISKVKIVDLLDSSPLAYMPYVLTEQDKPWTIAHDYYGDVERVWLVYLSNNITDPYYDWYMSTYDFEKYLKKKYGSIETAQSNIEGYQDSRGVKYSKETYIYSTDPNKALWTPIYSYNRENQENENKREIKLLERNLAASAESELKTLLNV